MASNSPGDPKGKQRRRRPRAGSINYCNYKNPITGKTEKLQALGGSTRYYVVSQGEGGAYSSIYVCLDKETGREVCVKAQRISGPEHANQPYHEAAVMEYCKARAKESPHMGARRVAEILASYTDHELGMHYIVMPLAARGDAFSFTQEMSRNALSYRALVRGFMCDILLSVHFLHSIGVYHRDIKLENFLVYWEPKEGREVLKIADFGFATMSHADEQRVKCMGSVLYCAPELLVPAQFGRKYSLALVDAWAVATCLFALVHDRFPYVDVNIDMSMPSQKILTYMAISLIDNLGNGPLYNGQKYIQAFCEDRYEWMIFFNNVFKQPSERPTVAQMLQMDWPKNLLLEDEQRRCYSRYSGMLDATSPFESLMAVNMGESRSTDCMAIKIPQSSGAREAIEEGEAFNGSMSSRPIRGSPTVKLRIELEEKPAPPQEAGLRKNFYQMVKHMRVFGLGPFNKSKKTTTDAAEK